MADLRDRLQRVLGEAYALERELGGGGMARVFVAEESALGRKVVLKVLPSEKSGGVSAKRFAREIWLSARLSHPHIVPLLSAGEAGGQPYYTMPLVDGQSLRERLAGGPLPVPDAVSLLRDLARALAYAHAHGVTHRDIKPGNILYAATPTDVRISDFGLALNVGAETTQITGVGSPAYMSPEQIREELVDHRTDLYSLGVVMYQLLSGVLPFRGTNKFSMIYQITQTEAPAPSTHRPEVPAALDRIVRRAMQKEAARRYHSGDEFAADLIEALRSGLGQAGRELTGEADRFAVLRSMRFFADFADPELWEVIERGQWERVAAGTTLIREGQPGDFFCVLVEGEVRVTKNKKLLSVLGPGECFGEMAYLSVNGTPESEKRRGASVTASAHSQILRMRVADLEQASIACRSKFDRAFIGILVERLNLANTRLTSA
jgi:hypothetical protein